MLIDQMFDIFTLNHFYEDISDYKTGNVWYISNCSLSSGGGISKCVLIIALYFACPSNITRSHTLFFNSITIGGEVPQSKRTGGGWLRQANISRFIGPCKSWTDARFGMTQFVTPKTHVFRHSGV